MYKLTQPRLEKAKPLLNRYRAELHQTEKTDAKAFERELCDCWNVSYKEMKDLAKALLKYDQYRFLSAYYMENSNGSGQPVAMGFKAPLAKLYGIASYNAKDRETKRAEFWATMPKED